MLKDEKKYNTQPHPDGNRARDADGQALDEFGRVPEKAKAAKPATNNQAEESDQAKSAGDKS